MTSARKITIARALIDWLIQPATLAEHESADPLQQEVNRAKRRLATYLVARTKYRAVMEMPADAALQLADLAEVAIADPRTSPSAGAGIRETQRQLRETFSE